MNRDLIVDTADEGSGYLEKAHTLLWELYEKYFGGDFDNRQRREAACNAIDNDLEFIATVLWAADELLFEYNRDMSAALGVETFPVKAFVRNTRKLYGAFLTEQPAPEKGGGEKC